MQHTVVLDIHTQLKHTLHLFCVIAASVVARNVANQEILDAIGPQILGKLYVSVALVAGIIIAAVGWVGREYATRRVVQIVHIVVAIAIAASFFAPAKVAGFAVAKYLAMEISFAALLLVFGLMIGASLGPREARQVAARVGAGGVLGGLAAGAVLSAGALLIGSRALYLVAAVFALAPAFFLPRATIKPLQRVTRRIQLGKERSDVPALAPYGRWVALTTLLMVAATTLIDYQFRSVASNRYDSDAMTAFFGFVVILAGCTTVVFQLTLLNRMLEKLGLFGTATVMPAALIVFSALFGLVPTLTTLVILKLVDSGTNMSLQQATGGLLLAPLSPSTRSVWQGRIDGLAKRGGQALTGVFLILFPWTPTKVLPIALILCVLWIATIMVTRTRYVRLLTEMLGTPQKEKIEVDAYDGSTLRFLETELAKASPGRASVILELLEQVGRRAPDHLLKRIAESDPDGEGASMVIDHLAKLDGTEDLIAFANSDHPTLASAALLALADIDPRIAQQHSRELLSQSATSERITALAAGILAESSDRALALCDKLVRSDKASTRLAAAQSLGRAAAGAKPEIGKLLARLAEDPEPTISRLGLEALGRHPSEHAADTALRALRRREVRGAAMRALAEMGPPVVPFVSEELGDRFSHPRVASALAWALGRIGAESCVPALVKALDSAIAQVRLDAAVALSTIHRRSPDIAMPIGEVEARYLKEISYYTQMRATSLQPLPEVPAAKLLLHTLKQRGRASLETLFRMLSLKHPLDAMQGVFQALISSDRRRRQVALELLDNLLDPEISRAIADAVGGVRAQRRQRRSQNDAIEVLATGPDPFLASLALAVQISASGNSHQPNESVRRKGDTMALTVVDQILELQSLSIFSQSSAEDLQEVAALISAKRVRKGTVLFREGENADAMYIVRTGEIALSHGGNIIDQVGAGEACGIVACLDQLPRELTATATMDASILCLSADGLLQLLADRPLLMHSVFRALTGAIRQQLERGVLGKKKKQDWSW